MKKYSIALGLIIAAISLNFKSLNFEKTGAVFSWELTTYDFGTIEQHKPAMAKFKFQNTGDQPLVIVSTKGSCGCTVADYTKGEILPGKYGEVSATYNAKKPGAFTKTVTVYANTGDEPIVLTIKGKVETLN